MSHLATSIAPARRTCDLPDHIGRKAAHAFSIMSMFQSLPQTHAQVAHTSASLAKACRYLASADCCSLRLCSSASSLLFCLASSICLMSLHSHLGESRFIKLGKSLFSTLHCDAVSQRQDTYYMTHHHSAMVSWCACTRIKDVIVCVQQRHSGTAGPVSKCLSWLEAMLLFTVRPLAIVHAQALQRAQSSCSLRMRCRQASSALFLAIRMPGDIGSTNKQGAVTDLTCVCAPSFPPQSYLADVDAAALEAKRSELQSQLQGSRQPHGQHAALAQQAGLQPPAQWTDQPSFVKLHCCLREEAVALKHS